VTYFRELFAKPEYAKIPLAGQDNALYEIMFRSQPAKFISRPRFLTVMRMVRGPRFCMDHEVIWCSSHTQLLYGSPSEAHRYLHAHS
jgi:hypothetical protein